MFLVKKSAVGQGRTFIFIVSVKHSLARTERNLALQHILSVYYLLIR